jgi:ankyrin repeat protein
VKYLAGHLCQRRLDVLQSYFDESGARQQETSPKQIESGFLYACGYGKLDAARFLLDRGIDPATRDEEVFPWTSQSARSHL